MMKFPDGYDSSNNLRTNEVTGNIPCIDPILHAKHHRDEGCIACTMTWLHALPWHFPFHYRDDHNRVDDALLLKLKLDKKLKKRTFTFKDYWLNNGEEWRGFACEIFCLEIGEREPPISYPYARFAFDEAPNLILHICRWRMCYEPQQVDVPLYLEIHWLSNFSKDVLIQGLDPDLSIKPDNLEPLLRLRAFLFGQDSLLPSGEQSSNKKRAFSIPVFRAMCFRAVKLYAKEPREQGRRLQFTLAGVHRHIPQKISYSYFCDHVKQDETLETDLKDEFYAIRDFNINTECSEMG